MAPLARGIVRIDLADEIDLVAPAGDGLGHDLLGAALAVHLGGVDQVQAEIEAELQRLGLGGPIRAALAHVPRAEPEHRHAFTVLELDLFAWLHQLLTPPTRAL